MWSDNESAIDLLGFQHLSELVASIVRDERLLPATVGVFGDWGSGKSSLLEMVKAKLEADEKTILVSFNGWQFEGFEDAKDALIGTILDELKNHERVSPKAKELAVKLLKRLDLLRIAGTLTKYAVAFGVAGPAGLGIAAGADAASVAVQVGKTAAGVDVDDAVKFIKESGAEVRQTVRQFRKDFEALLDATDGVRLVVLIDDLDRCMPETIIETLEAIKLFLFVPKTAYIIGADERLVKYAVRRRFPELPGENAEVGRDYLEKLVQYPVRIPLLDRVEMETYINLLFAQLPGLLPGEFEKARVHVVESDPLQGVRFNIGVANELFKTVSADLQEQLGVAQRIAPVLAAGLNGNPRQCKRFLNMLMMRIRMADSRKIKLQQRTLAKLMLLEYFKPEWFQHLAELQAASEGYPPALVQLERTVRDDDTAEKTAKEPSARRKGSGDRSVNVAAAEAVAAVEPPPSISQETLAWASDNWMREWLLMEPALTDTDLRPYFYFSRDSLGSLAGAARRLSPRAQDALNKLLQDSDAVRALVLIEAGQLSPSDAAAVFEALAVKVGETEDLGEEGSALDRIFEWVEHRTELRGQLITLMGRLPEVSIPIQTAPKLLALARGTDAEPAVRQLFQKWTKSTVVKLAKAAQLQLGRSYN